jgi:hypothetical protein
MVEMAEEGNGLTLFRAIESWLERAPFVSVGQWSFLTECVAIPSSFSRLFSVILLRYRQAVEAYASHQAQSFKAAFQGDAAVLQAELARIDNERHEILQLLSPDHHTKLVEKGLKRLSFDATIAALMIHLYASLGHSFERVFPKHQLFLRTMFAAYAAFYF